MKLKVFMWQVTDDRLPTGVNLKKRKWKGSHKCLICGQPETGDHILFSCILARFVWACIKEALDWERTPVGLQDFLNYFGQVGSHNLGLVLFCLAIVLWGLWTTRNKYAIEGTFATYPTEILFKIHVLMQKWKGLLKEEDRGLLEDKIKQAKEWLEGFTEECKLRPTAENFM